VDEKKAGKERDNTYAVTVRSTFEDPEGNYLFPKFIKEKRQSGP